MDLIFCKAQPRPVPPHVQALSNITFAKRLCISSSFVKLCKGAQVEGTHWLRLSSRLEKRSVNRLFRINETGKFKAIRDEKITRDRNYSTIINQYKRDDIDHDEYVRKIVKLRRFHDVPKTKKELLRRLEKSEDSDTE